jgi:CRP-like cAMP-binding protein
MDLQEVAELLAGTELCKGLSEDERKLVAELGRMQVAFEDSVFLKEGEAGSSVVVLLDGEGVVEKNDSSGQPRELARAQAGAVLGEIALLEPVPRTASIRAVDGAVRYLELERRTFQKMLTDGSAGAAKMALNLASMLARRQRAMNAKLVAFVAAKEKADESAMGNFLDDIVIDMES